MRLVLFLLVVSLPFLPLALELILIRLKPQWFARLASRTYGEHAFVIHRPKAGLDALSGYRDGRTRPGLPSLPEVMVFSSGRLVSRDGVLMLQPTSPLRGLQLLRIDVKRDGDTLTLRARRVVLPASGIPIAVLVGVGYGVIANSTRAGLGFGGLIAILVVVLSDSVRAPFAVGSTWSARICSCRRAAARD